MSPRSHADLSPHDAERIAAELAALGEPELEADELASLTDEADTDLAFVEGLREFAEPLAPRVELEALASRRVWSRVRSRVPGARGAGFIAGGVLLAAAAALLVLVLRPDGSDSGEAREAALALRAQAHAGLEALGVDTKPGADAARVRGWLGRSGEGDRG